MISEYSSVLIVLGISIVAMVCYDRFVCPRADRWAWRHNLASTLISVALGIATAIGIFQYQGHQQDAERRTRLCMLLNEELVAVDRDLAGPATTGLLVGSEYMPARPAVIQTLIIDEAIKSGLFGDSQSRLLTELSLAERAYNARLYHYLAFLAVGTGSLENAKNAATNLEAQRSRVLPLIGAVKTQLRLTPNGRH